MDMRKLIQDTDFDNVREQSKKWKREEVKENIPVGVNPPVNTPCVPHTEPVSTKEVSSSRRNPLPQVMDEDTQHFRNRLQHLLGTFKIDAVSQFMAMKRTMLECQRDTVKSDTQKYLNMYEDKHQQLLQLKQAHIVAVRDVERMTLQHQLMVAHIAKLNLRLRVTKYLTRPFNILVKNMENAKLIKMKVREAEKAHDRKCYLKGMTGWKNIFREAQKERETTEAERRIEMEVSDIVGRYQKEMETMKHKLIQATRKNEEYEQNKIMMQQNLKKAFLRGISAMNMQAMGMFSGEDPQQHTQYAASCTEISPMGKTGTQTEMNQLNSTSSVIFSKSKIQSKEHKWKEAPVLGIEEREEIQQPRMQVVKPMQDGKVIKVVDGRSAVSEVMKKPPSISVANSRKKI